MGWFKKAEPEPETNSSPSGEEEGPQNPLEGMRVVNGEVVFDGGEAANENGGHESRISTEDVKRFYTEDKFHNHVVKVCAFIGRKKGYQSLQISEGDEAFRNAVEVVYRRLSDSAIAPLLERLGDQALEDAIIVAIGFGPVVKGVMQEKVAKRKAAGAPVKEEGEQANVG